MSLAPSGLDSGGHLGHWSGLVIERQVSISGIKTKYI